MANGTVLNFGRRYKDNLRVIFYQWPKLGLGLVVEAEIQILKVIQSICVSPENFIYEVNEKNNCNYIYHLTKKII